MDHDLGREGEEKVHRAEDHQGGSSTDRADVPQEAVQEDADADRDDENAVDHGIGLLELVPELIEAVRLVLTGVAAVHFVVGDLFSAVFALFHTYHRVLS